ncbi:MAG TPA: class I SAM-dependent methyltransferase [Spongiibacteraceae bacterium]|nr:class I SAM-dependent methyltransferase [Spongiibacteraceae bacterium]
MPLWKHQPPPDALAPILHAWYQTDLGRTVLRAEQRLIERCLTDAFGYHLLQLGIDSELTFYDDCRVQRCFKAGPVPPVHIGGYGPGFVQCDVEELPFESDSLDVVIVHHALEFAANPHAVLRELYRVAVPEGRIVLVGFNPWSPLGARMALGRWRSNSIWRNHFLSVSRLHDWLQLLGFAMQRTDYGFHRLPLHQAGQWPVGSEQEWTRHCPGGGVYAITAIKQVSRFIPMKPLWARARPALSPLAVVKPSTQLRPRTKIEPKQVGNR